MSPKRRFEPLERTAAGLTRGIGGQHVAAAEATIESVELQTGMATLNVRHLTTYRYARPVEFGEHRMMMRPRDGHDQRLLVIRLEHRSRAEAAALAL